MSTVRKAEQLAEFVGQASIERLPADVVQVAKRCLLDTLGAAIFGSTTPWAKHVTSYVLEVGGRQDSSIYGRSERAPAALAALANGTMAHSWELDDIHEGALLHPGAVVVPAALAVAEREHSSGTDLLVAIVVGYEVLCRVGLGIGISGTLRGFHGTGTSGPFGAAAAASKLMKLSHGGLVNALAIAGSRAAGPMEFYLEGPMVKRAHPGWAAEGGIVAAALAQRGMTGPSTVFEGKYGYLRLYSDDPDVEQLTIGLGEQYEMRHLTVKPYSCCGTLHGLIDAGRKLREEGVTPEQVERVVLHGPDKLVAQHQNPRPTSTMAAQYSAPYVVIGALYGRAHDPSYFSPEKLDDPDILKLTGRVEFVLDPELDALYPEHHPVRVVVQLKDGSQREVKIIDPTGTPAHPPSDDELREKFRTLAGSVLDGAAVERIARTIDGVESLGDVNELTALVRC